MTEQEIRTLVLQMLAEYGVSAGDSSEVPEATSLTGTEMMIGVRDTGAGLQYFKAALSGIGYVKPTGGIPASDLAAEVQQVLAAVSGKEGVTAVVAPVNQSDATAAITTLACEAGKYYRIDVAVETLAVTLPAMSDNTKAKTVVLYLTGGTTPAVTISSTAPTGGSAPAVRFSNGYAIESGKTYEVNCLWNGAAWIVASVEIEITNP